MNKKISLNELRYIIKQIIIRETLEDDNEARETLSAKKYVDDMIDIHGDFHTVRRNILDNLVNSPYQRVSNSYVNKVWKELFKRFE
jgi:hypothetical protein